MNRHWCRAVRLESGLARAKGVAHWWVEFPEFRDGQSVCINDAQAARRPDGSLKMLVGPEDPGEGNWLDTKGRSETILLARYLLPEDELAPIITRVVTT